MNWKGYKDAQQVCSKPQRGCGSISNSELTSINYPDGTTLPVTKEGLMNYIEALESKNTRLYEALHVSKVNAHNLAAYIENATGYIKEM